MDVCPNADPPKADAGFASACARGEEVVDAVENADGVPNTFEPCPPNGPKPLAGLMPLNAPPEDGGEAAVEPLENAEEAPNALVPWPPNAPNPVAGFSAPNAPPEEPPKADDG